MFLWIKLVNLRNRDMNLLNGKPVKAFIFQDHEAHIKVHMNAMQDPYIQDILKNNPAAPGMEAAAQAHIAEHVAFLYRSKLEEQLGVALPPTDEKIPEDIEVQLLPNLTTDDILGQPIIAFVDKGKPFTDKEGKTRQFFECKFCKKWDGGKRKDISTGGKNEIPF